MTNNTYMLKNMLSSNNSYLKLMVYYYSRVLSVSAFLCAVMAMSIVHIQDLPAGTDLKLWPFFCFQILIFIVLILICFQGMAFGTSSISFQVCVENDLSSSKRTHSLYYYYCMRCWPLFYHVRYFKMNINGCAFRMNPHNKVI